MSDHCPTFGFASTPYPYDIRLAVLTSGGDCPGLNAAIRSMTRKAESRFGDSVIGFYDSWDGVMEERYTELNMSLVRGLLPKGGTMLGTRRGSPLDTPDGVLRVQAAMVALDIDALIVVAGPSSQPSHRA